MSNSKFIITELYWERIQLHVKGKIENISLENYTRKMVCLYLKQQ